MYEHARAAARHADVAVVHLERSETARGISVSYDASTAPPVWHVRYPHRPTALSMFMHMVAALVGYRAVRRAGFVPDVLHAHFFLAGVPAVLIGRLARLPVVLTEHWSIFLPEDPMLLTAAMRRSAAFAFRNADVVLPVSEALENGIESHGLKARRFEVVRNVVDTALFQLGSDARNGRLLAVGSFYPAKGYDTLLATVAHLVRAGAKVALDIVGDGPQRAECEALARSLGIEDNVSFHGLLAKPAVARMMREAELLVLSSRYDNNPCVVMEALACGLPVVATAVGGVPELIDDSNGRLAKPEDPESMATAIRTALGKIDSFDRAAVSNAACTRYGTETIAAQLAAVYASVIGGGK